VSLFSLFRSVWRGALACRNDETAPWLADGHWTTAQKAKPPEPQSRGFRAFGPVRSAVPRALVGFR